MFQWGYVWSPSPLETSEQDTRKKQPEDDISARYPFSSPGDGKRRGIHGASKRALSNDFNNKAQLVTILSSHPPIVVLWLVARA